MRQILLWLVYMLMPPLMHSVIWDMFSRVIVREIQQETGATRRYYVSKYPIVNSGVIDASV